MGKELYVTIIEKDNTECPNIGTIHSLSGNEDELTCKLIDALISHFDVEVGVESINIQDGLDISDVRNSVPLDAVVTIDGVDYNIELQQTFFY